MNTNQSPQSLQLGGFFRFTAYTPDGTIKWVNEGPNLVTNEGIDHALDVLLHNDTQTATWYIGLKNVGTAVAADTLASHGSWTENTNYTGDRQEYVETAASSQSINNTGNEASFTSTADSQSIAGGFLSSVATGTSGILLSIVDFPSAKALDIGDSLQVEYVFTGASA